MSHPEPKTPPRQQELLLFYDDFVEFHDHCAFLCEAVASMVAEEDRFDTATTMGIKRYCYWLQDRADELHRDLKGVMENAKRAGLN